MEFRACRLPQVRKIGAGSTPKDGSLQRICCRFLVRLSHLPNGKPWAQQKRVRNEVIWVAFMSYFIFGVIGAMWHESRILNRALLKAGEGSMC